MVRRVSDSRVPAVPVRTLTIPPGRLGTVETLAHMRRLVLAEFMAPIVRETAVGIARSSGPDAQAQAALIRQWLEEHTTFVRDPRTIELLTAPAYQLTTIRTIGTSHGDCDDVAMLGAALGLAIGLRARFVALGRVPSFEHVFTALGDPSGRHWWELDITRRHQAIPRELQANVLTVEV